MLINFIYVVISIFISLVFILFFDIIYDLHELDVKINDRSSKMVNFMGRLFIFFRMFLIFVNNI